MKAMHHSCTCTDDRIVHNIDTTPSPRTTATFRGSNELRGFLHNLPF